MLSDPSDPYYTLALEIAAGENIILVNNPDEMTNYKPNFALWVISPDNLTEKRLVEYSQNQGRMSMIS